MRVAYQAAGVGQISHKKENNALRWRTCHTVDFGQIRPENDTHDWSSDKVVMQRTMAKCGKKIMPLVRGLCLTADFDQVWSKLCPSLEDFVVQWTSTKCGPKWAPHWRTLSHSGLWPNASEIVPLVEGLCHSADLDQMWYKICPLSEDFVSLWTSTKCGPNICRSSEDFVTQRTLTKCGSNMCLSTEDFVLLQSLTTHGVWFSWRGHIPT